VTRGRIGERVRNECQGIELFTVEKTELTKGDGASCSLFLFLRGRFQNINLSVQLSFNRITATYMIKRIELID
jgi:hypothetical protein